MINATAPPIKAVCQKRVSGEKKKSKMAKMSEWQAGANVQNPDRGVKKEEMMAKKIDGKMTMLKMRRCSRSVTVTRMRMAV